MRSGNHRLRPRRRLTPISRIAAPKTVLTPGIETGTRKTIVRNAERIRRPSCPTRSRISASVTLPGGNSPITMSSFAPMEPFCASSRPGRAGASVCFPRDSSEIRCTLSSPAKRIHCKTRHDYTASRGGSASEISAIDASGRIYRQERERIRQAVCSIDACDCDHGLIFFSVFASVASATSVSCAACARSQ